MADLITSIGTVITWIMGCFSDLFNFITSGHEILLFPIGLALIGSVIGVVFKVTRGLGLRAKKR